MQVLANILERIFNLGLATSSLQTPMCQEQAGEEVCSWLVLTSLCHLMQRYVKNEQKDDILDSSLNTAGPNRGIIDWDDQSCHEKRQMWLFWNSH